MLRIFAAILLLSTFALSAAYDYGQDLHKDGYAVKAVDGGRDGWYMNVLKNTSLSFSVDLSSVTNNYAQKNYGNLAAESFAQKADGKLFSALGIFTYAAGAATLDDVNMIALNFNGEGVATVDGLTAGTQIGFWMTDAAGNTFYSTKFAQGARYNVFNGREAYQYNSESGEYEKRVFMYSFGGAGGTQVLPVLMATGVSGQPLPGVLVSLLLGGGVLGGFSLCKRAKKG